MDNKDIFSLQNISDNVMESLLDQVREVSPGVKNERHNYKYKDGVNGAQIGRVAMATVAGVGQHF